MILFGPPLYFEQLSSYLLMQGVLIFLIILFVVFPLARIAWQRWVQPWLIRRATRKMEDYLRAATGMPPREETRKKSKDTGRHAATGSGAVHGRSSYGGRADTWQGPLIPKEYAVDVEYVEVREYSSTVEITGSGSSRNERKQRVVAESQVSDVEYTEILTK